MENPFLINRGTVWDGRKNCQKEDIESARKLKWKFGAFVSNITDYLIYKRII